MSDEAELKQTMRELARLDKLDHERDWSLWDDALARIEELEARHAAAADMNVALITERDAAWNAAIEAAAKECEKAGLYSRSFAVLNIRALKRNKP